MTPRQVTHLRICQRLLFIIAQHISQLLKIIRTETQVESLHMSAMNNEDNETIV